MNFVWIILTVVVGTCVAYPISELAPYIVPEHYDVQLALAMGSMKFSGMVSISFKTTKNATRDSSILLNSEDLAISTIFLKNDNGREDSIINHPQNETLKTIKLALPQPLEVSTGYTLDISFSGDVSTDGYGLYTFNDSNTQFYMTNLYPFYARRLFPCFDSPEKKAKIRLSIVTNGAVPVASTRKSEEQDVGGMKRYIYETTPSIPLSSLFFLAGPSSFSQHVSMPWGNVPILINPSFKTDMFFNDIVTIANSTVIRDLWAKVSLNMNSFNIIVVPDHVEKTYSGYGVAVIRKDLLEFNLDETTTQIKINAALNVLHGIIKVYFGSVLSPKTWQDKWLSDSVSLYLRYKAFDNVAWGDNQDYLVTDVLLKTLQPGAEGEYPVALQKPLATTEELEKFLSGPSVLRGAAILSMLETFNQQKTVIGTLMDFLDSKKFDEGVTTQDFYDACTKDFTSMPLKTDIFLNDWIYNTGYPSITLKRESDGSPTVYQEQLIQIKNAASSWNIPLSYISTNNPTFDPEKPGPTWLTTSTNALALNGSFSKNDWVVTNFQGKGCYATNYDDDSWENIFQGLQTNINAIPSSSRAKLVSDAFSMARSGKASYVKVLKFLMYLDDETELAPWLAAIEGLDELWSWIFYSNSTMNLKTDFKNYAQNRLIKIYTKLGTDPPKNNNHTQNALRREIVRALCSYEYDKCITRTTELYKRMITPAEKYKPQNDMSSNLMCAGLRQAQSADSWDTFYTQLYENEKTTIKDEILDIHLDVLACPRSRESTSLAIREYLDVIFRQKKPFPKEKVSRAYRAVYSRPEHIDQALYYFLDRQLVLKIGIDKQVQLVNDISRVISTQYHISLLNQFKTKHPKAAKALLDAVDNAIKVANDKKAFIEKYQKDIKEGLNSSPTPPPRTTTTEKPPLTTTTKSTGTSSTPGNTTSSDITPSTTGKPLSGSHLTVNIGLISFLLFISHFLLKL